MFSFSNIYAKINMSHNLSDDPLIFLLHRSGPANSSELVIMQSVSWPASVNDQYFEHKFEYMLARDKHNHDKQY